MWWGCLFVLYCLMWRLHVVLVRWNCLLCAACVLGCLLPWDSCCASLPVGVYRCAVFVGAAGRSASRLMSTLRYMLMVSLAVYVLCKHEVQRHAMACRGARRLQLER